jgi:hypothetical protein
MPLKGDSTPSVLFKTPRTYLLEDQRFLRGLILQWGTKDAGPELLNEVHIMLVDIFPGLVLGHAKLDPVWKDDAFVFRVERFGTWFVTGSFTIWRVITRKFDMILSQQCLREREIQKHVLT